MGQLVDLCHGCSDLIARLSLILESKFLSPIITYIRDMCNILLDYLPFSYSNAQSKQIRLVSGNTSSLFSFQYNTEQRQREMEEEKKEELQQLIRKSKNEQSEYLSFFAV